MIAVCSFTITYYCRNMYFVMYSCFGRIWPMFSGLLVLVVHNSFFGENKLKSKLGSSFYFENPALKVRLTRWELVLGQNCTVSAEPRLFQQRMIWATTYWKMTRIHAIVGGIQKSSSFKSEKLVFFKKTFEFPPTVAWILVIFQYVVAHIILCWKSPGWDERVKFWQRTSSQRVNPIPISNRWNWKTAL